MIRQAYMKTETKLMIITSECLVLVAFGIFGLKVLFCGSLGLQPVTYIGQSA
jgi:hypothetical protein